jgi:glycosyltransferase involved in cell wall biosynthesis
MHAGSTGVYLGAYLKKITLPGTDWIFPSGNREMQFLMQRYQVRAEKMSIIRPPIDFSFFKPMDKQEAARALRLPEHKRYFLYLGRLDDSMKRVSSIIRAFQKIAVTHTSFDLIIAGNGKDEEELKGIAKLSAGDRIHFLGWAYDQTKAWLLNIAEGLVLASRREGFPTVIGEAMACGTPVIAPDVGTIADLVIPGKTGWLYPACNDEKLFESMLEMASETSPLLSDRMHIREYAIRHVSFDAVSRELIRGFHSTLIKKSA